MKALYTVTVVARRHVSHCLTVRHMAYWPNHFEVYIDGVSHGTIAAKDCPKLNPDGSFWFFELNLELSNGKSIKVSSSNTPRGNVFWWAHLYPPTKAYCDHLVHTYRSLYPLRPGDIVSERYRRLRGPEVKAKKEIDAPFRLDLRHRCLTNGRLKIPFCRPYGSQWHKYRHISCLKDINAANWSLMLRVIWGKRLHEIIEISSVRQRMEQIRRLDKVRERAKRRVEAVTQGRCLIGRGAPEITVGANCITTFYQEGQKKFAVDSPMPNTALYVFDDYEAAKDWATRRVSWRQATDQALVRVTHHTGWEHRHGERLRQHGIAVG